MLTIAENADRVLDWRGRAPHRQPADRRDAERADGELQLQWLGERLVEGETEFEMDLNTGLTQALSDGTNSYLYGNERIGQFTEVDSAFFLGDALGSVRQLVNMNELVTLVQSFSPYGKTIRETGSGETDYSFTGEFNSSPMNFLYLRARFYNPSIGMFTSRDTWRGIEYKPISYNSWLYTFANPINLADPTGMFPEQCRRMGSLEQYESCVLKFYNLQPSRGPDPYRNILGAPSCWEGSVAYSGEGYIEGGQIAALTVAGGREVVYDFARMSSGKFGYSSNMGIQDSIGAIGYFYAGYVNGLDSNLSLEDKYKGDSVSYSFGIGPEFSIAGPAFGTGFSYFHSLTNPYINGATFFVGGGVNVDKIPIIDVGIWTSHYWIIDNEITYIVSTGKNYESLVVKAFLKDIDKGIHPIYSATGREYAKRSVLRYAKIYKEMKEEDGTTVDILY